MFCVAMFVEQPRVTQEPTAVIWMFCVAMFVEQHVVSDRKLAMIFLKMLHK